MSREHGLPGAPVSAHDLLLRAYDPLRRSFLTTATIYYGVITASHCFFETGTNLLVLAGFSAATSITAGLILLGSRAKQQSLITVELTSAVLHLLMLANVLIYQYLHFEPPKLVYFPLLAVAFAMSGVTTRYAVISVTACIVAMLTVVQLAEPEVMIQFVFIALATAFATIGLSTFLRGVIEREVLARVNSDNAAKVAHDLAETNERMANQDMLTGLPNRRSLLSRIASYLLGSPDKIGDQSLCLLNVNKFKSVNELYGRAAGDALITEISRRLLQAVGGLGDVARAGGDEFALLLGTPRDAAETELWAGRLVSVFEDSFNIGGTTVWLSGSFGLSTFRPGDSPEMIVDRADYAVQQAKFDGSSSLIIYSEAHETRASEARKIERALRDCDLDREIVAAFQPIVAARSGKTVAFEALARWSQPDLGPVSPAVFIPLAERHGLISTITRSIVRQSLQLLDTVPSKVRISINLSIRDLCSSDDMRQLCAMLAANPAKANRLDFEVTESAVALDFEQVNQSLNALRRFGAGIFLDDFGTGHSSLSRVQALPLSKIKIDRSFVQDIETSTINQAIVKTTLDLAKNLGISCVIEGVEELGQVDYLRACGAEYFQGYFFSRPLSREAIIASIERTARHKAALQAASADAA